MARRGSKTAASEARTQQERARVYQARAQWNADQKRRRVRDNVLASILGGLLVIGAFASQAVHAVVTEPVPEPSPTSTPVPEPIDTDEPDVDDDTADEDAESDEDSGDLDEEDTAQDD
ncbi:hypothetical protein [Microbacterium sp. NIBRBAC000506063]|uniref:hypothetical protein n=1 Tax=Microbacterium sp. NIBRBAC000506063 TaxID=2734618 RepID=UPI001BB5E7D0|nr:hypothetical protein [Microbacterium sp. NIBRBAC000506063]QTV79752.1 hypothetical protein KAE78_13675 [Microbacterium sp. NIBRBAC000506063]